jgi:transcriptional regulator with XRE-family HTH domain
MVEALMNTPAMGSDPSREALRVKKQLNFKRLWKARRQELDITQKTAADQLGMTQGAFSQYLNGHTEINEKAVLKIAKFLGVPPVEIDPTFDQKMVKTPPPSAIAEVNVTKVTNDSGAAINKQYLPTIFQDRDPSDVIWVELSASIDVNPVDDPKMRRFIPKGSVLGCLKVDEVPYSFLSAVPRLYLSSSTKRKRYSLFFSDTPPALKPETKELLTVISILFS